MVRVHSRDQWYCRAILVLGVWVSLHSAAMAEPIKPVSTPLFERIYTQSVTNLAKPDQTFVDITALPPGSPPQLYAATSKTCSTRCSKSCSNSCTTTRGCSSNCKSYTDGCGGTTTAPPQTPAASAPEPSSLGTTTGSQSPIPRSADEKYTLKDVQLLLQIAGYQLVADGEMNASTQASLADFQGRNGMTATGVADDALWRALVGAISTLDGSTGVATGNTTPGGGKGKYWINSESNTRHNSTCRWYGTTKKGYYTDEKVGKACGICGG